MALNRCENVAPSLAKVYEMKQRLNNAKSAAQLLRRKARVFDLLLRDHSRDLVKNTELMIEILREAFIALAAANYSNGDFFALVEEIVDEEAQVKVTTNIERSLAGARVYTMLAEDAGPSVWPLAGLSTGGHQITECKKLFYRALQILVNQVTLRSVVNALYDSRVSTMRKSMVVEHVTVPYIQNTIAYIKEQLDDMEREDMYRLKKIKEKILVKQKMLQAARQKNVEEEEKEPGVFIDQEIIVPMLVSLPVLQLVEAEIASVPISEAAEEPTHLDKGIQVSVESLEVHICGKKPSVVKTPCGCSKTVAVSEPVKIDEYVQTIVKPPCCSTTKDNQEDDIKPSAADVATTPKCHKKKICACRKK